MPTTPPYPSVHPGQCPTDEWVHFGKDCVLYRSNQYTTWHEAKQQCQEMGSDLASVKDADENWLLHDVLTNQQSLPFDRYFWLGLTRQSSGQFGTSVHSASSQLPNDIAAHTLYTFSWMKTSYHFNCISQILCLNGRMGPT